LAVTFWPATKLAADPTPLDPLAAAPTLKPPSVDELRKSVQAWLDHHKANDAQRAKVEALWPSEGVSTRGSDLLDRVASSFALADDRAKTLVEACAKPRASVNLPETGWLESETTPEFERDNLRLLYARWLSHERLYDELLEQTSDLEPDEVVDPASLLFYRGVACHWLLQKDAGLKVLDRLLNDVANPPPRHKALAHLMRMDLQNLDDKTLDHIARRMDDITRHLDLGRAGQKVVKIEDGVIESLDKLIKEMEDQQKQQQQQQSSGGGSMRPSSPMPDSQPGGGKGPGEVDRRRIGNTAGWGELPAKEREQALQQIGKDFPSHYRDVIEQYFRKLASEETEKK
jgi:hypothetical protein